MVLFTPYALPMSYYPFTVLIKRSRYVPSCSFLGDSATPKGCAGIEPATTQRVSPRLLPSAFVYTTEFHPNRRGRIRTSEAFRVASGLRLLWPLAYSSTIKSKGPRGTIPRYNFFFYFKNEIQLLYVSFTIDSMQCSKWDLNPHAFRQRILSPSWLPLHHSSSYRGIRTHQLIPQG